MKIEVRGVNYKFDNKLGVYVSKKVSKLDKYIPKTARESAHAEVFLKEINKKKKKECVCEVVLHLPHENITVKESTINMYAAVDIVETKLKNQIKKYKEQHGAPQMHHRLLQKLRRTKHEA